jgi:hypothetical protein
MKRGKENPALAKVRAICAELPDTSEGTHHDKVAFKVGKRLFATFRDEGDDAEIALGLEPDHADLLLENDPRFTRYPRAPNAVVFRVSRVRDWRQIRALLAESHALAAPKKKRR